MECRGQIFMAHPVVKVPRVGKHRARRNSLYAFHSCVDLFFHTIETLNVNGTGLSKEFLQKDS